MLLTVLLFCLSCLIIFKCSVKGRDSLKKKKKKARLSNADSNQTKQATRSHPANDKYTVLLQFEKDSSKEVFRDWVFSRGHTPQWLQPRQGHQAGAPSRVRNGFQSKLIQAAQCYQHHLGLTPHHRRTLQALELDSENGTSKKGRKFQPRS